MRRRFEGINANTDDTKENVAKGIVSGDERKRRGMTVFSLSHGWSTDSSRSFRGRVNKDIREPDGFILEFRH
jgi:hypothetical protein